MLKWPTGISYAKVAGQFRCTRRLAYRITRAPVDVRDWVVNWMGDWNMCNVGLNLSSLNAALPFERTRTCLKAYPGRGICLAAEFNGMTGHRWDGDHLRAWRFGVPQQANSDELAYGVVGLAKGSEINPELLVVFATKEDDVMGFPVLQRVYLKWWCYYYQWSYSYMEKKQFCRIYWFITRVLQEARLVAW